MIKHHDLEILFWEIKLWQMNFRNSLVGMIFLKANFTKNDRQDVWILRHQRFLKDELESNFIFISM